MVLKELIFNSFYFTRVWWSSKYLFLIVFTLGGCGGLERTVSICGGLERTEFLLRECVVVLKELIFHN